MKKGLLGLLFSTLLAGCASHQPAVWLIKVDSVPPGARIFSCRKSQQAPGDYLGTAPCYAQVSALEGGWVNKPFTLWAYPPTNAVGFYPQSAVFRNPLGSSMKLPQSVSFDLAKPPAAVVK